MSNDAAELTKLSDEQLVQILSGPMPGSQRHEQIKFEMERRTMVAQQKAAAATLRGAIAAERYTKATWVLIAVTVIASLVSLYVSSS